MTLYGALKSKGDLSTNFVLWAEGLFDIPNDINKDPFICSNADYVQKHNAAAFFANSRNDECPSTVVWKGWAQGTLPPPPDQLLPTVNLVSKGVAFVIPGQDHNGHNGGGPNPTETKVQAWNNWLQGNIPQYVNYALNKANKTLLIITQDEKSGGYCGDANHIILFLIAGDLQAQTDSTCVGLDTCPGVVPGQAAQYNILRTITKNFNLANLGHANTNVPALIPPL